MSLRKHRSLFDASQQCSRQWSGGPEFDTSTLNRVVAQLHFEAVIRQDFWRLVGPFDCDDGRPCEVITKSNGFRLFRRVKTIQIDMCQGQPAAVFVQEHKGRTADRRRGCAKTCGDSSDKYGFASSQRTGQCQ